MNCYVRLACSMCFQLTNAVQCARLTPPTSEQGALTCSGCNQKRAIVMHDFLQLNIPKLAIVFFLLSTTTTMDRLVIKSARWYIVPIFAANVYWSIS